MGMRNSYYRVPSSLFEQWQTDHDEVSAHFYINHTREPGTFPYTIRSLRVDASIDLHRLLNPIDSSDSILWHVVEGATSLGNKYDSPSEIYIDQIRFLSSTQVQAIADALRHFDFQTFLQNFARSMDISSPEPQNTFQHPMFQRAYRLFEHTLCFFQIAAEQGDAILRIYG